MTVRLVATDLDGTVLVDDAIGERTRAALAAVRGAGAMVTVVTARGPWSGVPITRDAGIAGHHVLVSGSVIYDTDADRAIEDRPVTSALAAAAVEVLRTEFPGVAFACARDGAFDHEPAYRPGVPVPRARVADALELIDEPMWKLIASHDEVHADQMLPRARALLGDEAWIASSGGRWIEIMDPAAGKGPMLARLAERMGIDAADVVAFGDLPIDIPMLTWAGHGVAPGDAHEDTRAAADEVTDAHDADGVAMVLERLLNEGAFAAP